MNRKLCLLFLVCLAAVLIKCESFIEVDENGDEYEVKKFNIQGRQLNEGRSQCVMTRRKRSTQQQPKPMYVAEEGMNDEVDDKDDGDTMMAIEQHNVLYYSPPTMVPTADAEGEEGENGEEEMVENNSMNINKNMKKEFNTKNKNKFEEGNDDYSQGEDEEDAESGTIEVVQLPQLPILGQLQSDGESVAAVASASNGDNANGIVVIQSHNPPKVNPQTHAVFELVPVNQSNDDDEDEEDDVEDSVDDDFDLKEDISPVTTTAIWSTGDDNSNNLYDDFDKNPIKITRKTKKPLKTQKKKKNSSMKPKRKNKNKLSNKRRLIGNNNKRRNKTKRPNNTSLRRPVRKHKLRRGYNTSVRPQNKRKQNSSDQQNKKKHSNNSVTENKKKDFNNNKKLVAKKHKNRKHAEVIDQGSNTYTRTMTMTQTGDEDGDKNVNCIIIRKDPPPTTPRPFWNILGRNANGAPIASGHYGKRKRVNVRFVA